MRKAFTLSEVLITLGILGIVIAMTLPALIGKWQKVVFANKVKYNRTLFGFRQSFFAFCEIGSLGMPNIL